LRRTRFRGEGRHNRVPRTLPMYLKMTLSILLCLARSCVNEAPAGLVEPLLPVAIVRLKSRTLSPVVERFIGIRLEADNASLRQQLIVLRPTIAQFWNPATDAGRATLDAMITRQAQIIAYIDDFKLLMIATLAAIPLLIVFKRATDGGGDNYTLAVE
jgi:hypothetical protein